MLEEKIEAFLKILMVGTEGDGRKKTKTVKRRTRNMSFMSGTT